MTRRFGLKMGERFKEALIKDLSKSLEIKVTQTYDVVDDRDNIEILVSNRDQVRRLRFDNFENIFYLFTEEEIIKATVEYFKEYYD